MVLAGSTRTGGAVCVLDSLACVIGGVVGTVTRTVAAEETCGVLGGDGRVLAGPPGLRFHPCPLQDVVRVLTCSWADTEQGVWSASNKRSLIQLIWDGHEDAHLIRHLSFLVFYSGGR